ncbi:hypothetical protein JCM21738_3128 [Mesobacillus boroniphilus JCM 21738]|uniref:Uncharacterized protein n=1 Tax=Mesobacillus boroniphilus JCM 21738 TaxID=1294265 RepID=W4RRJ4_9BACI|nr:hypothetical protein JCM21738_3128 [Mesobacillus boroniphilus JCM 21738]
MVQDMDTQEPVLEDTVIREVRAMEVMDFREAQDMDSREDQGMVSRERQALGDMDSKALQVLEVMVVIKEHRVLAVMATSNPGLEGMVPRTGDL